MNNTLDSRSSAGVARVIVSELLEIYKFYIRWWAKPSSLWIYLPYADFE